MKRFYLLALLTACVTTISAACIAAGDNAQSTDDAGFKAPTFIASDKIVLQLLAYENDPKNFLRFSNNRVDRDIRISVQPNLKNVKLIDIIDIYAKEERCDYRHSAKSSYQYFDPPINTKEIITTISKPCIYKHNAKLKLKIATQQKEHVYRIYTFPVHPLSNFY